MNCVCHQQNFHKSLQYTIENWMDFVLSSGVCVYGLSTRFSLWQRNKKRFTTYLQSNKTQNQYKTIEFVLHIFFFRSVPGVFVMYIWEKNRHITHYMHFYWLSVSFFSLFCFSLLKQFIKRNFFWFPIIKTQTKSIHCQWWCVFFHIWQMQSREKKTDLWRKTQASHFWKWIKIRKMSNVMATNVVANYIWENKEEKYTFFPTLLDDVMTLWIFCVIYSSAHPLAVL